jgi:hypothetical protein
MILIDLLPQSFRNYFGRPQPVEVVVAPVETVVEATPARPVLSPEFAAREATLARAEAFRSTMFCPARLRTRI